METNLEKKARLKWNVTATEMTCTMPDGFTSIFHYDEIKEFNAPVGIVAELFQHGLKQKLADSVAGMTKNGITYADQALHMESVWKSIKTGEAKTRSNSSDPKLKLSDVVAKIMAMEISEDMKALLISQVSGK